MFGKEKSSDERRFRAEEESRGEDRMWQLQVRK